MITKSNQQGQQNGRQALDAAVRGFVARVIEPAFPIYRGFAIVNCGFSRHEPINRIRGGQPPGR